MKRLTSPRTRANRWYNDLAVCEYMKIHSPTTIDEVIDNMGHDAIQSVVRLVQIGAIDHVGGVLRIRNKTEEIK
jgi:hypothetical protein